MRFQSMLAIYVLFWTISLFVVLPFGVRTAEEEGLECEPGHAPSAPHSFSFGKTALRTTIVAAVAFAIFYANYHFGWVPLSSLEWTRPPGQ